MIDRYSAIERFRMAHREMGRMLDQIDWLLFEVCANCGHRLVEHRRGAEWSCASTKQGGCSCSDFEWAAPDVVDVDALAELEAEERRREMRAA